VERAAESQGAEIADEEHNRVEKMGRVAPTMYLGMDGTGVPLARQCSQVGHLGTPLNLGSFRFNARMPLGKARANGLLGFTITIP
jgi:hypothetical protein